MPTIAHISDLHLQSGNDARQAQVDPILQAINDAKPDLVVISGDITDDGWDSIEELKWAKAWLDERIDAEWFAVPGNHDVGNFVTLEEGPVSEPRVTAWERIFGWNMGSALGGGTEDAPVFWSVLGFNSMLFGSGAKQETLESQWLAEQLERLTLPQEQSTRHVVLFVHSPFFVDHPDEKPMSETAYWLGPAEPRYAFYSRLGELGVKLIGCGHVHQTRVSEDDGVKIAWAPPASGTWVHAPGLPNPPMPERTGFFLHTLHDDGRVETKLIECAPMLKLYEHTP